MKSKTQFKQLLLIFLVFTFSAAIVFGQNCGDINADGSTDIVDALLVAQCYVGLTSCPSADIGDVNCDGSIDIVDALLIAQLYVSLISTLHCCDTPIETPDPTPGADVALELQAETDAAWDDAVVESDHSGYTGSGYVNTVNAEGQWIEWTIDVDRDCNAVCVFTYATAGSDRPMSLSVNGNGSTILSFPDTGAWTTWSTETAGIILNAGSNAIRLTATSSGGAPNMDKMDITIKGGGVVTPTPISTQTPTASPTPVVTCDGTCPPTPTPMVQNLLDPADYEHYIQTFNSNDADEAMVKSVPNSESWNWIVANIPFFECSTEKIEEIYYFRWWSFRKHINKKEGYSGYVMTEFYNWVSANSSAYCHHLAEGRWMQDKNLLDEYTIFWYQYSDNFHKYSQWSTDALYKRYLVNFDKQFIVDLLDDLIDDYKAWEDTNKLSSGLFWSYDVRDAMEESISGSRTEKNVRPTLNSYMAANAKSLAEIARLAGRSDVANQYQSIYESLRGKIIDELWDPGARFFKVQFPNGELCDAREAIGYIPWMFGLPGPEHEEAWLQIRDPEGFLAPKGLTTAERRHPDFRSHVPQGGTCEWDGAVWPFATSQTLTGLATVLRSQGSHPVDKGDYYQQLLTYATSHEREGIPHIGEYHDEVTGRWLRDVYPRSWFYNHSTYCDLVITGLVGLVPRGDDIVEVDPLVLQDSLSWFALHRVLYHGYQLTILWDKDGSRYGQGVGLKVYADGRLIADAPTLTRVTGSLTE